MKQITIKVIDRNPDIKAEVLHTGNGLEVKCKPKAEWKNHSLAHGHINIDGYSQRFTMSVKKWSLDDYERQWQEGLDRILDHDKSCLITNIGELKGESCITWWLLYRIGDRIHIQSRILFNDDYEKIVGGNSFTPSSCFDYIPARQTHEDDGEEITELLIDLDEE
jgi:hypothetical protein